MAVNPKIIVLSEQLRGQSFELTQARYSIGRGEDCDICIPDPTISGHHCTLVRDDDEEGYVAQDEGSTNGTRVNGVRVHEVQKLTNSDIIQVGAIEMLFDSQQQKGTATAASTQTGINLQSTAGTTTVSDVQNFSPFASGSGLRSGQNKASTMIIAGIIGILIVAVIVVVAMLLVRLMST